MAELPMTVVPLGAGQDVGRSCILVSVGGKTIMFDCGMHMGYHDHRRFPNFDYISKTGQFTELIDAVVISHFHLDHCGALPHFTEQKGYDGPIIMTHPTKAIVPILLQDFRKIMAERYGVKGFFSSEMIENSMQKVTGVNLHEVLEISPGFTIQAYYAGHVIGAAMFRVCVGDQSVVYTGDYNMTPDRHLGSAWMDLTRPDLLITESTYATTIRESKRQREQDFLERIKQTVEGGGKVLIPVFALGRAQELCILIDTFWERFNLKVPIYFAQGLTTRANEYYKLFINWTNQKIKNEFPGTNRFDFERIGVFDRSQIHQPGPMVVFATPGMLHAGLALDIFKVWGQDPLNLLILPGYCVAGTVGNKVLSGQKSIEVDQQCTIEVKCQVANLSFSAHADAKGIMQLIRQTQPRNVMLVHGEKKKMEFLAGRIEGELGIKTVYPANGHSISIAPSLDLPVMISSKACEERFATAASAVGEVSQSKRKNGDTVLDGCFVVNRKNRQDIRVLHRDEMLEHLTAGGKGRHALSYVHSRPLPGFLLQHDSTSPPISTLSSSGAGSQVVVFSSLLAAARYFAAELIVLLEQYCCTSGGTSHAPSSQAVSKDEIQSLMSPSPSAIPSAVDCHAIVAVEGSAAIELVAVRSLYITLLVADGPSTSPPSEPVHKRLKMAESSAGGNALCLRFCWDFEDEELCERLQTTMNASPLLGTPAGPAT